MGNTPGRERDRRSPRPSTDRGDDHDHVQDHVHVHKAQLNTPGPSIDTQPSHAIAVPAPSSSLDVPREELNVFGSPLMSPVRDLPPVSPSMSVPVSSGGDSETVVLQWPYPADDVECTGSFNSWGEPWLMRRSSQGVFETTVSMPPGDHEVQFLVDGQWRHDPNLPVVQNTIGDVFNVIRVTQSSKPRIRSETADGQVTELVDSFVQLNSDDLGANSPEGSYGQHVPKFGDEKPPKLPPLLLQVTLNSGAGDDPTQIPAPNNVNLNHLYALSIKDNVVVLGASHRYQKKFVTTVIYKLLYDEEGNTDKTA